MKKIIVLSSIACASLLLTACSKESAFKSAINENIHDNYACIHIGTSEFFSLQDFSYDSYKRYEKESADFVIRKKENNEWSKNDTSYDRKKEAQLDTLVKAGLLEKTEKTEPAVNRFSNRSIDNESFVVEVYDLTKEGEKAQKKDNSFYGGVSLCYAQPEVNKILNYREASPGGVQIAEVKYSYHYIDVAGWAKDKDVQAAYPDIKDTLDKTDNIDIASLEKTSKGWQTGL